MKITLGRLFESREALTKISNAQMPLKTAYEMFSNLKTIGINLDFLENERKKLIVKHGMEQNENNEKMDDNKIQEFMSDFKEILNMEVDIELGTIKVSDLDNSVQLSPREIGAIDFLIQKIEG